MNKPTKRPGATIDLAMIPRMRALAVAGKPHPTQPADLATAWLTVAPGLWMAPRPTDMAAEMRELAATATLTSWIKAATAPLAAAARARQIDPTPLYHLTGNLDGAGAAAWDAAHAVVRMIRDAAADPASERRTPAPMATGDVITDAMPAAWFNKQTRGALYPDLLRRAQLDGRIRGEKPNGRWTYSRSSVAKAYPQYAGALTDSA